MGKEKTKNKTKKAIKVNLKKVGVIFLLLATIAMYASSLLFM